MKNDRFLKRLKKELPLWVERGWVKEEGQGGKIQGVAVLIEIDS